MMTDLDIKCEVDDDEFVDKKNELLIKEVEKFRLLYDTKLKAYRDIGLKEKTWWRIGQTVGMTPQECQHKYRNLRDRYRKEKKKLRLANSEKESLWPLFKSLDFLESYSRSTSRRSRTNSRLNPASKDDDQSLLDDFHVYSDESLSQHSASPEPTSPVPNGSAIIEPVPCGPSTSECAVRQDESRKRPRNELLDDEILKTIITTRQSLEKCVAKQSEEDLFGASIAAQLSKMSQRQKAHAMLRIQQVMYDCTMMGFEDSSRSTNQQNF